LQCDLASKNEDKRKITVDFQHLVLGPEYFVGDEMVNHCSRVKPEQHQ